MIVLYIILGIFIMAYFAWFVYHQRRLRIRAHIMQEAIRNHDFTFRLPTRGMFSGERAMQEALNQMSETIRQEINQNEVESWERLTRVLTHEMMNATAPITSISQSLLSRPEVKDTPLEDGIQAIYDTSKHLSEFVTSYRKMSQLEKPSFSEVALRPLLDDLSHTYPQLSWDIDVPNITVQADAGMLRQVLMNMVKNAIEANAKKMVIKSSDDNASSSSHGIFQQVCLYVGNDGLPIPAEARQSVFVPFFTTKRSGNGIGLSLSRRMMLQQGGMLELADQPRHGCHTGFVLTIRHVLS